MAFIPGANAREATWSNILARIASLEARILAIEIKLKEFEKGDNDASRSDDGGADEK